MAANLNLLLLVNQLSLEAIGPRGEQHGHLMLGATLNHTHHSGERGNLFPRNLRFFNNFNHLIININ